MEMQQEKQLRQFLKETYQQGSQDINLSVVYQKRIYNRGVQIVTQVINWPIKSLNLSLYGLQDQGMQSIIKVGKKWKQLKQLRLSKNNITCKGLVGLSNCEWTQMMRLVFDKNHIKAAGFQEIAKAGWKNLERLQLAYNQIGEKGAQLIYQAKWENLLHLDLNYNLIGNKGMKYLSLCNMGKLESLLMSNNKIDAKGVFYLQKMQLAQLRTLLLNRNNIGLESQIFSEIGCIYLSRMKINGLKYLHVFGNKITLSGMRTILHQMKLQKDCFLQITRNQFVYEDIKKDVDQLELFCNVFG